MSTNQNVLDTAIQGWIIYCPEEQTQLGNMFTSSDDAQRAVSAHNSQTGHHAFIQPFYDLVQVSAQNSASFRPLLSLAPAPASETVLWPFCILWLGKPALPYYSHADSYANAIADASSYVSFLNQAYGGQPYFTFVGGSCS